jgi:hypothetical protein
MTLCLRLLAIALFVSSSSTALAKEMLGNSTPTFGENPEKSYQSSQWFALEFKFGPYTPHIDQSAGLHGTPFSDLFNPQGVHGQPPSRLLTQVEFDVQFLHKFGSLGVGVTAGYARRTTHGFVDTSGTTKDMNGNLIITGQCEVPTCTRSGDQTALNVMPFSLLAVYRFDYLAQRYHVPFVPYFKIGLAYYVWWIENGSGSTASFVPPGKTKEQSQPGYGGTFGWVLNPGISFLLDVIDPSAARTMDAELGINHTYLFFELHYADISGFGASNKMNLSDTTYNTGIAFEF